MQNIQFSVLDYCIAAIIDPKPRLTVKIDWFERYSRSNGILTVLRWLVIKEPKMPKLHHIYFMSNESIVCSRHCSILSPYFCVVYGP